MVIVPTYGEPLLPVVGFSTTAEEQVIGAILALFIVTVKLQFLPSKVKGNVAVAVVDADTNGLGVPVTVKVKFPAPVANVPAFKVAVNPVTPIEDIGDPAE